MDKFQQLEKLAELKDKGVLSEEEFAQQKLRLLNVAEQSIHVIQMPQVKPVESAELRGTYWIPVPALIFSIMSVLTLFDDSPWDSQTIGMVLGIAVTGIGLGILGLATQPKGRGLSIAAIVLGVISSLCLLGLLSE